MPQFKFEIRADPKSVFLSDV